MEDKFLKFLEQEEKHAHAYYLEELRATGGTISADSADYWRGYADAASNALAAYAGPTDLETIYLGQEL